VTSPLCLLDSPIGDYGLSWRGGDLGHFLMADLLEWPFDLCTCSEADQR
jgi:hypothetical protein